MMNQIMDNPEKRDDWEEREKRGERDAWEEKNNCWERDSRERKNILEKIDIRKKLEQRIMGIRRKAVLRAAGLLAGGLAFVWWCVLYPELCFPQDTYEAVSGPEEDFQSFPQTGEENPQSLPQTGEENPQSLPQTDEENLHSLLQAEEEQVIVKSRLLEWLEQHGYIK